MKCNYEQGFDFAFSYFYCLVLLTCATCTGTISSCSLCTNAVTKRVSWSEEVRTICGILAASGFGSVPWNPCSAGLLFVAGSVFLQQHSSYCTGHWDRGGRSEKNLGGGNNGLSQPINVSCSASAHWLFASLPSRVLSDQPLSLTA